MGEKCEVTLTIDFTKFFSKHGKSGKYEKAMYAGIKGFNVYFQKLQKKNTIDLFTAMQDGDKLEVWITADRSILEDMIQRFKAAPKPGNREDKKHFSAIQKLENMYDRMITFSEVKPLKEDKK